MWGEKYDWKQPNRLLVVQTGESFNQAKVCRAQGSTSGPLRKSDQCVEEQHRDEPL